MMTACTNSREARRARPLAAALLATLLALPACSASTTGPPAPEAVPGWPSSMAALGHSGLTGSNSGEPAVDALENSWATGDNPEVDSVYARIVAENPAMAGHGINLAVDGSDVEGLLRQAEELVETAPDTELVIIQSIDHDIQCDGTDAQHLPTYRQRLSAVMDVLAEGLPAATVFLVSQWSSVEIYDAAVVQVDPWHLAGPGPCSTLDSTGAPDPVREAEFQAIVDSYIQAVAEVCADYEECRTDEGAMQELALEPEDLTEDLDHLSVAGQAKMAAIAWEVLYGDG